MTRRSASCPRRYILQAQGYMAITGLRRWGSPPAPIRVGADRDRDLPDLLRPRIIGAVLEHAERFVVDYLRPKKPPPGARWSRCGRRPPGCGLGTMAAPPLTVERAALLERYREACQALKRAEVSKDFIQAILAAEVRGDAKGDRRGQGLQGVVRLPLGPRDRGRPRRRGRDGRALGGRGRPGDSGEGGGEAIADATKKGTTTEPGAVPSHGPKASRPKCWPR